GTAIGVGCDAGSKYQDRGDLRQTGASKMAQQAVAEQVTRNIDLDTAVAEAETRYGASHSESLRRYEAATKVQPGGNTRTVLFYPPFPVTLVSGEGPRIRDADGHVYTDFLGEYSAGLYGHSQAAVREAIRKALDDGIVLGGPNQYEGRLAAEM